MQLLIRPESRAIIVMLTVTLLILGASHSSDEFTRDVTMVTIVTLLFYPLKKRKKGGGVTGISEVDLLMSPRPRRHASWHTPRPPDERHERHHRHGIKFTDPSCDDALRGASSPASHRCGRNCDFNLYWVGSPTPARPHPPGLLGCRRTAGYRAGYTSGARATIQRIIVPVTRVCFFGLARNFS